MALFNPHHHPHYLPSPQLKNIDELFMSAEKNSSYPPSNQYISTDETQGRIDLAVAGFKMDELSIEQKGNQLILNGEKLPADAEEWHLVKQGIAQRHFTQCWTIRDGYDVSEANLKDGILMILFKRRKDFQKIIKIK